MVKLFDKDGKEIEAITSDELAEKTKEAIETYKEEHPDKTGDLAVAEDKLKKAEQDLKTAKEEFEQKDKDDDDDDDKNKGQVDRLKKERDDALNLVKDTKDATEKQGKEFNEFKKGMFDSIRKKGIEKLSGGDEEIAKKIEAEFDEFGDAPTTEDATIARLSKAATIVNGTAPAPNFMDNATAQAGTKGEGTKNDAAKGEETENSKNMRNVFGISDKDVEEFSPKED